MATSDFISGPTTLSDTISSVMATSTTRAIAILARTQQAAQAEGSSSWLGLLARLVLFILHILSTMIYWSLKLTTISVPTLLFTFFSTSLTVTMNATTLYISPLEYTSLSVLTALQGRNTIPHVFGCDVGRAVPISKHVLASASRTTA